MCSTTPSFEARVDFEHVCDRLIDGLDVLEAQAWDASTPALDAVTVAALQHHLSSASVLSPTSLTDRSAVAPMGGAISKRRTRTPSGSSGTTWSSSGESASCLTPSSHAMSTVAKQRPKQYKRPTPSKFCHVCGRKSHNVTVAICARIEDGMCRKVVCSFCFDKYGWDRSVLDAATRNGINKGAVRTNWICTHCRGGCVAKAQCNTYGRTNYKRHLKLRQRRCDAQQQRPVL